mmetsp:Transcript_22185/g.48702  ORF Transcript_22185/g.48702 Transcript_22185/m.48702 type:complete len:365 (-) Transcript_22185:532-1626(-)
MFWTTTIPVQWHVGQPLELTGRRLPHPRAGQPHATQEVHDSLVHLPPELHLGLVLADGNHRVLAKTARAERALRCEGVGRLQAADVGPLLAEPLGAVLAVPHAHPVARAHQVGHAGLQGGARREGPRGEPAHRAVVPLHVAVYHVGVAEGGDGLGKEVLHQHLDDVLVAERGDGPAVVKVARQHASLGRAPPPERVVVRLQLVQHEEGAPGAPQRLEAAEDVGGGVGGDVFVQPDARGHDVDAPEGGGFGELRGRGGERRAVADHGLHALGAEREHSGVEVLHEHLVAAGLKVLEAEPSDLPILQEELLHESATLDGDVVLFGELVGQWVDDHLRDALVLDPPHVERGLMSEGVVVQQLHHHRS